MGVLMIYLSRHGVETGGHACLLVHTACVAEGDGWTDGTLVYTSHSPRRHKPTITPPLTSIAPSLTPHTQTPPPNTHTLPHTHTTHHKQTNTQALIAAIAGPREPFLRALEELWFTYLDAWRVEGRYPIAYCFLGGR